jgi:hypothetical protein
MSIIRNTYINISPRIQLILVVANKCRSFVIQLYGKVSNLYRTGFGFVIQLYGEVRNFDRNGKCWSGVSVKCKTAYLYPERPDHNEWRQ